MSKRRLYSPRCHVEGVLHDDCPLEIAVQIIAAHRMKHPGHRNCGWTPTKSYLSNKEEE